MKLTDSEAFQIVAFDFAVQCRAFDAEDRGGFAFVPLGVVQDIQYVTAFHFIQCDGFELSFAFDF